MGKAKLSFDKPTAEPKTYRKPRTTGSNAGPNNIQRTPRKPAGVPSDGYPPPLNSSPSPPSPPLPSSLLLKVN